MSNETKNTKESENVVENATANAENTQAIETNEPKSYKRTIIGAEFDAKLNSVWLRLDKQFDKGNEKTDSIGKSVKRLCESGAHPLFVLVCKKAIKPITSVCLFIGAEIHFDVAFFKAGEKVDGYTLDEDTWCITNVRIMPNSPDSYFIEAAKEEMNIVPTL